MITSFTTALVIEKCEENKDLKDHDGTRFLELWVAYTAFFLAYFTQPCNIGILFKWSHMKSEKDISVSL